MFDKIVSRVSKVLVLIVLLFVVVIISVFCIIPFAYSFITGKPAYQISFPTSTPEPTSTPRPTKTVSVGSAYLKLIRGNVSKQQESFSNLTILFENVTNSQLSNQGWKNNIYTLFDRLISLSDEASKTPCPSGYEEIQSNFEIIHKGWIDAKHDIWEALEYRDENALKQTNEHLQDLKIYYGTISSRMKLEGE